MSQTPPEPTPYNSPVIQDEDGGVRVLFAQGHPGFHDHEYREHRAATARIALEHRPGGPLKDVEYTEQEHEAWREVSSELADKHKLYACSEFLEAYAGLRLPTDRLPQLSEVSATLGQLTGFHFSPAAGLEKARKFYGALAERTFNATQYVRYPSTPRFSAEPDMIHEIVGHGSALAAPRWADIYELVGLTLRRLESPAAVGLMSRVFWFTLECGLVLEGGETKLFGASLLSSCGEMEQFQHVEIRPLDLHSMATQNYRPDTFQTVLYRADSFDHMEEFLTDFLNGLRDESPLAEAVKTAA
jgi:phenylalanine-4-hydroxylase